MSIQTLSALENAIKPYRNAGYVITSQTESSITLRAPARRFSWISFLVSLLILWPVALIYLIWFNQRRDRTICARMTSSRDIEIIGFTLRLFYRERKRQDTLTLLFITLLAILLAGIVMLLRSRH